MTNQAQTFHWVGYGLNIPQEALPAGLKQCEVIIKVGISGQFTLPQNTSFHTCMPDWISSVAIALLQ